MKKAKLLWIIYLAFVFLVALFFTLFVNQGMSGMFSVHESNGKIATFNSYLFLDFSKVENARKLKYEKRKSAYDEKRKKRVKYNNAKAQISLIDKMLAALKNSDELKKTLKKEIKAMRKDIAALAKRVKRARGAARTTLAERLKKMRADYREKKGDLDNIDATKTAAIALAAKLKKNQTNLSDEQALIKEKNDLKSFAENYERTSSAYEKELLEMKKEIDKYRIETILANATYKKIKSELGANSTALAVIPQSTVLFMVIAEQVEKSIPAGIGINEIPLLADNMAYDDLAGKTVEEIEKEIANNRKKHAAILKKIKKEGANDTLNNELKTNKDELVALETKLKNRKILDIILNGYTQTVDKVVAVFKQYIDEVTANVNAEGMPFPNFLTQGIFLGKYAANFPTYGPIVKRQLEKSKMKLSGIHMIEERLLGNDSQITKITTRKVFGLGEVLKSKLAETELDQFYSGFKALVQNIRFQIEQGGLSSTTLSGTSGGGGDPTFEGGGDPTLQDNNAGSGGNSNLQSDAASTLNAQGGGEGGEAAAAPAPAQAEPLSAEDRKTALKLFAELKNIYSALAPFFVTGTSLKVNAGVVRAASSSLKKMVVFLNELKAKHPKIIAQSPTDSSEGGTGDTISIQQKFDNAFTKIQAVNEYINQNITKLTNITNSGKWLKIILIVLFGLIGGALAFLTYKWDKAEEKA